MKLIRYIVFNLIFAACIYFGLFEGVEGAKNVVLFVAWLSGIVSLVCLSDTVVEAMKDQQPSVPRWIDIIYDIFIVAVFVWFAYWLTAIVYMIHIILLQGMWEKIEKMKVKNADA